MLNLPMRLRRADECRTHYIEMIPTGIPLSAVMSGDYWVHVRTKMALYDVIEAIAEDGTYEATFRVVAINKVTGVIKFRALSEWRPEAQAEPIIASMTARFEAKWVVGKRAFCVYEKQTGKIAAEGFASKEEAEAEALRLDQERIAA